MKDALTDSRICSLFRAFHQIPEYGDKLPLTKQLLCSELDRIGIPYRCFPDHDSVIADITGALPGKAVAYRADMDALRITEDTGLPYASTLDGFMHGCGHDAHTAIALCALERIYKSREKLRGTVRFLFEAGEEIGVGAQHLLDENALCGIDAIFSLHVGTLAGRDIPSGTFTVLPGAVSAAKDKFTLEIFGSGGHGAYPSETVDPIRISAHVITAIQGIISMEIPSGIGTTLTFGSIQGGIDNNSIPGSVRLCGTIRTQSEAVRQTIHKRIREITQTIPAAFGGRGVCNITRGSEAILNDAALARFTGKILSDTFGEASVIQSLPKALMASDDFARLAALVPGVYFFLSTSDPGKHTDYPNHNPRFAIDETVLETAVDAVSAILTEYLMQ